jgi:hypothetical protein
LLHAVLTILADSFGVHLFHGDDRIDAPVPAFKLNADRAEFDLYAIVVLEEDAIIIVSLRMDDFAEK